MSEELAVLRGGIRDGQTTRVQFGVRRLLSVSEAPGLLEIYEANGETELVRGNDEHAFVFVHVGQESAEGINPELLHAPPERLH
ncbi:MAG: hypothetical protein JWL64_2644 [Frankiales bacterium]|nr:hypothetical protein [Frankiales bacterium]